MISSKYVNAEVDEIFVFISEDGFVKFYGSCEYDTHLCEMFEEIFAYEKSEDKLSN